MEVIIKKLEKALELQGETEVQLSQFHLFIFLITKSGEDDFDSNRVPNKVIKELERVLNLQDPKGVEFR
ncbi:hypothetical protein L1987_37344 [Smallanthus sonchifolius]|uniref:Uncharacterized protein n=1 Tax=Smallanthus sonchifolius TaxID=185202 RepID=A0ACB9HHI3_9ASTR|nr:hypothetical protein L1987_37344 [Smallanthus sonchifolius]